MKKKNYRYHIFLIALLLLTIKTFAKKNQIMDTFIPVDFDISMSKSYSWNPNYAKKAKSWKLVRDLYIKNYQKNSHDLAKSKKIRTRIPKIIHWIWLGSPLPEKYKKLQESWIKFNPTWEFKVWTDKDVEAFGLKNKKLFDNSKNWAQKSDIWRYEILYRYGGLYVDTDFKCLKPFNLLHEICDFYTGLGYDLKDPVLYNGIIASIPKHPILKSCISDITISDSTNPTKIMKETGPIFFTKCFFKNIKIEQKYKNIAFPVTFFYPISNRDRHISDKEKNSKIQKESYAIHYYDTSWVK